MLLLAVAARGWGTLEEPWSAARSWLGTSLLEEASCQMFPDSLLRYCCLTGLFLDQVGFSTGYLKNICSTLEDKSPTWQKNPLAPGFFGEWGRMGWGQLGLQVKQKRGNGLLRRWSRVEGSFGWLYQLLSCVTLYWFSGVPKAKCPLSGVNHSWKFQHNAHIFSTVDWKFLITSTNQGEKHQQPNLKMDKRYQHTVQRKRSVSGSYAHEAKFNLFQNKKT